MLPKLGADYLKLPNIDRLCAEGVTFRNHFTQCAPCGPGACQPADQPLPDESPRGARTPFRSIRASPTSPTNCAAAAMTRLWSATPRPRRSAHHRPNDPRFLVLGDVMDGFRPVGAFEPYRDAYFGWMASQGYKLPENREDIWLPEGDTPRASRARAPRRGRRAFPRNCRTPPGSPSAASAICAAAPASRGSSISATTAAPRPTSHRRPIMKCTGPRTCPRSCARPAPRKRPGSTRCWTTM